MTDTLPTFGDFSQYVVRVWPLRRRKTTINRWTGEVVRHWGGPLRVVEVEVDSWFAAFNGPRSTS
jgi:hypothetical protein